MSYYVEYEPYKKHDCERPDIDRYRAGTIIRCATCGTRYGLVEHVVRYGSRKEWTVYDWPQESNEGSEWYTRINDGDAL